MRFSFAAACMLFALLSNCHAQKNVRIVRDDWGIAHVYGDTDADAVFGMIYAQCEDDFNRVETNYLNALGRLAEAEGESKVYQDLRMKLFIDPEALKKEYRESPPWLQKLMIAFADGANFYLEKHPAVKPRVIHHFEPWMALSFTEGSIGGDVERVDLKELEAFYGGHADVATMRTPGEPEEPGGSNGIALAPARTTSHHALLLINPHTSFFFRSELQMTSREGLNAYGAATWGQFFIYQGFNERVGWMHTSSGVDAVDEYLETVVHTKGHSYYRYGKEQRPVVEREITVPYATAHGMDEKKFTVYYTHHGPVVRNVGGRWVAIRLMQRHVKALMQSYLRTKALNYQQYLKTMELKANSSNNTIYADADGHIAYFHGNYIPRRNSRFDFTKPVDGADPSTDWHGLLAVNETPHLLDPKSGYVFNVNDSPWNGAGESSLRRNDYPAYVETGRESARGAHAIELLHDKRAFSLDSLVTAAYDSYLPWFSKPLPKLISAWNDLPHDSALKSKLASPIAELKGWDLRWGTDSVATSVAIYWGQELAKTGQTAAYEDDFVAPVVPPEVALKALSDATEKLTTDFGTWKMPWGQINRFQRLTGDIVQPFNDAQPSLPVGFTSSTWGSLASFGARPYPGTRKWYGTGGNSFVAVVEFGDKVHARAVTAGGESGHPQSKHFNDQGGRYASGDLREVYFYPDELAGHTERTYRPGDL